MRYVTCKLVNIMQSDGNAVSLLAVFITIQQWRIQKVTEGVLKRRAEKFQCAMLTFGKLRLPEG